jgi:hypothetical protein
VLDPYTNKPKNRSEDRPLQKQRLLAESGLDGLVCGFVFGAEGGEARMVQAVATDEMDYQQ